MKFTSSKYGLDPKVLNKIIEIIISHKGVEKIVIFGSRSSGKFDERSDIDIAIFARDWMSTDINLVKDQLEENISVPQKFDLMNFYNLSKATLIDSILGEGKTIYDSKENQ